MRVAVFFGGSSREREVSFAGGRTVIDNLDKNLFQAIPVFIESSANRFILLDWPYLYKGTIRDFYPDPSLPEAQEYQIYAESLLEQPEKIESSIQRIGKEIHPTDFKNLFDFAFLALHGPLGEDGSIQGLLEWYGIPYSGSGTYGSSLGISKSHQSALQELLNLSEVPFKVIVRNELSDYLEETTFERIKETFRMPMVIKSSNQGSSLGITVLNEGTFQEYENALYKAFFIRKVDLTQWRSLSKNHKKILIKNLIDIREGIGLPICVGEQIIYLPQKLHETLDKISETSNEILLEALYTEQKVLIERFVEGKEFSCIVIGDMDNHPIGLPPTQIVKKNSVFDYRAKYLPGISRKVTPIDAPIDEIEAICSKCEDLYHVFNFDVYARIDGFLKNNGSIELNDPNTTSGMMPSSFFFHQAAEIGLNPSRFLSWIVLSSLRARVRTANYPLNLLKSAEKLATAIKAQETARNEKIQVAVIMGGYSSERHISVESGRNIYEKLASSGKYKPVPLFLTGSSDAFELFELPIHIMLKDNADDIAYKLLNPEEPHEILDNILWQTKFIQELFSLNLETKPRKLTIEDLSKEVSFVFIALHGRPGEDGALQKMLDQYHIPYNGSAPESASITINKYETNKKLAANGISVASHVWLEKKIWLDSPDFFYQSLEDAFGYPMILKPADDGCSSAVKKISNRQQLVAYTELLFRDAPELNSNSAEILQLAYQEEFPQKEGVLAERLIDKGDADHFLEITGGFLTHKTAEGLTYEFFEPSEVLSSGEILSLEEKFLAGEGQNITPARFHSNPDTRDQIAQQVKKDLEKAARCLQVEGYGRIDAFVRIWDQGRVETIIIEINSLPGMTPATCIFHQCALQGYTPFDFIDRIIQYGLARSNQNILS